jgi:hypothetical protein
MIRAIAGSADLIQRLIANARRRGEARVNDVERRQAKERANWRSAQWLWPDMGWEKI